MPYRSTPQDRRTARIIGVLYVFLAIVLGWMLFKIWPPIPWPAPKTADDDRHLLAYLANTGCADTSKSQSTTATATQTTPPVTVTNTNPGQTGTQPTTPTATQPSGGGQPDTQPSPLPGATPQPDAVAEAAAKNGVVVDRTHQIISMPINFFGKCPTTTFDERLILLVIVAGMLGAFVHGATSLADYIGNNNFNSTWTWFYFLRPAIGMCLALVFYFVIRGGFLSTTGGAADINPYGIAALAGLVGMFSKQATDKLGEVFTTLFRSAPGQGDAKRQDPLKPAPGAIKLDPASVVAGGDTFKLTVTGSGFVQGDTIKVNDGVQTTTFESATALSAQIPRETIATRGVLKVTVVNHDQTVIGLADLVVS